MNQTIYFRKDIWPKFEKEEKKSELINHLLEEHYEMVLEGSFKQDEESIAYYVKPAKVTKSMCKEHGVEKEVCKHMKHK